MFFPFCRYAVLAALMTQYIPYSDVYSIFYDGNLVWLDGQGFLLIGEECTLMKWLSATIIKRFNGVEVLSYQPLDLFNTVISQARYYFFHSIYEIDVLNKDLLYSILGYGYVNDIWYTFGIGHLFSIHHYHLSMLMTKQRIKPFTGVMLVFTSGLYLLINPTELSLWRIWLIYFLRVIGRWADCPIGRIELWSISTAALLVIDVNWVYKLGFWLPVVISMTSQCYKSTAGYLKEGIIGIQVLLVLYIFEQPMHLLKLIAYQLLNPFFRLLLYPLLTCAILMVFINLELSQRLFNIIMGMLCQLEMILSSGAVLLSYQLMPYSQMQVYSLMILILMNIRYVFLLLIWLIPNSNGLEKGELRYHMLDVGHGLCIVLETQNHTLIYDAGSMQSKRVKNRLRKFLYTHQINAIDAVIYSHADFDHTSAQYYLSQNYHIKRVYSGEAILQKQQQLCQKGHSWKWDDVTFRFLHPDQNQYQKGNDASCVLHIHTNQMQLLLTGDITHKVEKQLLKDYPDLEADVLLAAHHGSKTSSSNEWLQTLDPKKVLISAKDRRHISNQQLYKYQLKFAPYSETLK